jgi:PleD family two-component response regulator
MTKRKILVVDDNVDSATMLEMLLSLNGHEVRSAFDGASAITTASEFVPDVVLLDLTLPDQDGFEVAVALRGIPELARTVLVAVTGWSDPDVTTRALSNGFHAFLVKPIEPEMLERTLQSVDSR